MSAPLYLPESLRRIEAAFAHLPLMQRAGTAAADWAAELSRDPLQPVLVLAGPGNNGGDAFVAARLLRERFFSVHLAFAGRQDALPPDAAAACADYVASGGEIATDFPNAPPWGLIIDGLFGIGLGRPPAGLAAEWIERINAIDAPRLALDCPSGLDCVTGVAHQPCVQATHTLSFIGDKPGLHTADGPDHCGEIRLASLGLDLSAFPADGGIIDRQLFQSCLQPRRRNSHKGSYGSAGILGGAHSMQGAALLAGRAALRLGSGRVYVGLLDNAGLAVDFLQPELMLRRADALPTTDLQALAIGPGLGTSDAAGQLLDAALASPLPLVLDADALNLMGADGPRHACLHKRPTPTLLTPHPAEAARLLACSTAEIQADRLAAACRLAARSGAWVVLKGCGSIVATPQGRWWINTSGNPGMASAGMGDVLSGLITALLAQGWPATEALLAAVHLHGLAADRLSAKDIGPAGMTAGEVIDSARLIYNHWLSGPA